MNDTAMKYAQGSAASLAALKATSDATTTLLATLIKVAEKNEPGHAYEFVESFKNGETEVVFSIRFNRERVQEAMFFRSEHGEDKLMFDLIGHYKMDPTVSVQ